MKERENIMTIFLAILAGCNVIIDIITPVLLVLIWTKVFGLTGIGENILFLIALLATVFRGIKFWIKNE
jgi:hypothetical protein